MPAQEVLSTINIVKGIQNSFGAKTFMARAAVEIRPFLDQAGQELDKWYDLGRNHWSHEDGTVSTPLLGLPTPIKREAYSLTQVAVIESLGKVRRQR